MPKTAKVQPLTAFLKGATAAQRAQVDMIQRVFAEMDADNDGMLTVSDVRAYFRAIGRTATDAYTRRWIRDRDVDQDGAVSLAEFVASFALQLDPASHFSAADGSLHAPRADPAPVAVAFGALRLGSSTPEVLDACEATEEYVCKILESPSVSSFWRILVKDDAFHRRIGRLFGGVKLMTAMGFQAEDNGAVLAIRDPNGKSWDTVPQDVKMLLKNRLDELLSHKHALLEPSISNIAAGTSAYTIMLTLPFTHSLTLTLTLTLTHFQYLYFLRHPSCEYKFFNSFI